MWTNSLLLIISLRRPYLQQVGVACAGVVGNCESLCDVIYALWCEVFSMFGVQWVMPMTVSSFVFGRRNWFGKRSGNWNLVLSCLIRLVWKKRNPRAFQNIERSLDQMKLHWFTPCLNGQRVWGFSHCTSAFENQNSLTFSLKFFELYGFI